MIKKLFLLSMLMLSLSCWAADDEKLTANEFLTEDEIYDAATYANDIDDSIRSRFDALHQRWYEAAKSTPEVFLSSSSSAWTTLPQFADLKKMGQVIIPLVIEKMTYNEYHFTKELYKEIQTDKSLLDLGDKKMAAAQQVAAAYVKAWLNNQ